MLSIFTYFDCMQIVCSATISGLGMVKRIRYTTIIGYWIFGIPIAGYLAFNMNMKLEGLWYGPTIACAFAYAFFEYIVRSSDWDEQAKTIKDRMNKEKERDEATLAKSAEKNNEKEIDKNGKEEESKSNAIN